MKYKLSIFLFILLILNSSRAQWVQIGQIITARLTAVKFFNQYTGITCGVGGIWRTTNGGLNWAQVLAGYNFNAISFYDINNGTAVGDSGIIFRTVNGGLNWNQQASITQIRLYGVAFPTMNTGFAVGENGTILRTNNGGSSWSWQVSTGNDIYALKMINVNTGFAVGSLNREYMISTANSGFNWQTTFNVQNGPSLKAVESFGIGNILTVGANGRIRKSSNAGYNWTFPTSNTNQQLNAVAFANQDTCFISGNYGVILRSTNAGTTWVSQSSNTTNNLYSLSFINSSTGWAVGANGIVLNIGLPVSVHSEGTKLPPIFELYQNYPNPFNLATKIKFKLPNQSLQSRSRTDYNVQLAIFDVAGRLVALAINKLLSSGVYEVQWEGTDASSGIYLYTLTVWSNEKTKTFSETKRLVLLK